MQLRVAAVRHLQSAARLQQRACVPDCLEVSPPPCWQGSVALADIIPGLITLDTGQHPPTTASPAKQATPAPRPRRPTVGASRGWWPSWPVAPTLGVNQLPLGHATTCDVAAPSPPPRCTHGGANTSAWLLTPLSQSSAPESVSADQWSAADNLLDESKYRTPPRTMPTPAAPTGGGAADGALTGTPPVTPFPLLDASAHQGARGQRCRAAPWASNLLLHRTCLPAERALVGPTLPPSCPHAALTLTLPSLPSVQPTALSTPPLAPPALRTRCLQR